MIDVVPIPAFTDNYIWLMHDGTNALVVDPGDAIPVLNYLQDHHLTLTTILITHHHQDHTGGVHTLSQQTNCKIYAPTKTPLPCCMTQRHPTTITSPRRAATTQVLHA